MFYIIFMKSFFQYKNMMQIGFQTKYAEKIEKRQKRF